MFKCYFIKLRKTEKIVSYHRPKHGESFDNCVIDTVRPDGSLDNSNNVALLLLKTPIRSGMSLFSSRLV